MAQSPRFSAKVSISPRACKSQVAMSSNIMEDTDNLRKNLMDIKEFDNSPNLHLTAQTFPLFELNINSFYDLINLIELLIEQKLTERLKHFDATIQDIKNNINEKMHYI